MWHTTEIELSIRTIRLPITINASMIFAFAPEERVRVVRSERCSPGVDSGVDFSLF
jgi:hypothetical protein